MGRVGFAMLITISCFLPDVLQAVTVQSFRWTHYGLRPLGMGNAYVAVADDFNALFYNPAGLARLKSWDGEFLNLKAEVSSTTLKAMNDISKFASQSSDSSKQLRGVFDFLDEQIGKQHHFALGLTPHLIFPSFGIGAGLEIDTTMVVHRQIEVYLNAGPQLIMPIAYAMNFLEDRLSFGAGVKLVAKGGIDRTFSIDDIEALVKSSGSSSTSSASTATQPTAEKPKLANYVEGGAGVGMDMGILFTPIKVMEPTFGLSVMDVGGTPYQKLNVSGEALSAPHTRLPSVNTGVSVKPYQTERMYLMCSADAHAINQPVHFSKKFGMGVEWGYGSIIKLQTGLYQGNLSAGFQFDVGLLNLRAVTYAEELGVTAGEDPDLSDRRYAVQLKLLI